MFKKTLFLAALAVFAGPTDPAQAGGKNVAVIDNGDGAGPAWCQFLTEHGHTCTGFPKEGPTAPLDPFDVVIDLSHDWSDPTGTLADCMRAGKTIITWDSAPAALGIDTNATVQAWIGANGFISPVDRLFTTALDPILGNTPVGTQIANCADGPCSGLTDASGHPFAKVLARFTDYPFPPPPIGIMRNYWEGGVSVYLTYVISPVWDPSTSWIILNAVEARNIIPTVSTWGLLALVLGLGVSGTIVLRRRRLLPRSPSMLPAFFIGCLVAFSAAAQADVTTTQDNGVTRLQLGDGEPFRSTNNTVVNLRSIAIPNSGGVAVLWEEIDANGQREPFYAVSMNGTKVDEVRATSYDLQLRYARFDPTTASPAVTETLEADAVGELYIVQFVTQPLDEFTAAVEAQGATIYSFLPNHAYVMGAPPQAREAIEALPFVRAVVPYHPAYRLEPFLRGNLDRGEQLFPLQRYNIRVFTPAHKAAVARRIAETGGLVDSADAGKRLLAATLTPDQLLQVIRWDEVLFVDRWGPMEPDMNNVRIIGGANYIEQTPGDYRGSGVRGEVLDEGFFTCHPDFASRPLIEHGGAVSGHSHGTSTAGIIFGDGTHDPQGEARGLLPLGQGIVADWGYLNINDPPPLPPAHSSRYTHTGELVNASLPYKAVFQSTSGGTIEHTIDYTSFSQDTDAIAFDFDIALCQSQGNLGGGADPRLSRQQAWSKNTISVGGVKHENNSDSFSTNLDDPSDDHWCGTTLCDARPNCASIGPAADGRVKPDLVGFFDCIRTTSSCIFPSAYYSNLFWGTSAATPIVCGHVGLLMEMWADDADANGRNIFRVPVPSCNPATENCVFKRRPHASTAKAMLINTAMQYDWVAHPYPHPNSDIDRNKQGWGFPSVNSIYDFRNNVLIINENESDVLTIFATRSYNFAVEAGDPVLKATLDYADPPGNPSSSVATVNNLGLKVVSPGGQVYWGNYGLSSGIWSVADPTPFTPDKDAKNTVENVFVQNPTPGTWTVTVRADAINQDGHVETPGTDADFALVVYSGTGARGQCCFEDPSTCARSVTCASQTACTGLGYTWSSDKTCAEVCVWPGEYLCCIPSTGYCGLASPGCCSGNGGYVVTGCQICPDPY